MTVSIDVDLDSRQAYRKLAELETLMKTMGSDMDSLDFDFGDMDIDEIVEGIDDLIDGLKKADKRSASMRDNFVEMADALDSMDGIDLGGDSNTLGEGEGGRGGATADSSGRSPTDVGEILASMADTVGESGEDGDMLDRFERKGMLKDSNVGMTFVEMAKSVGEGRSGGASAGGGESGSGGATADGGEGGRQFSAEKIARGIEKNYGMDGNTIDRGLLDEMELDDIQADVAESFFDQQGVTGGRRNLGQSTIPGFMRAPRSDNVGPDKSLDEILESARYRNRLGGEELSNQVPDQDSREAHRGGLLSTFGDPDRQGFMDSVGDGVGGLDKRLSRLKPTIGKFYTLIGLLSPLLIAAAVQAAGVAAAMGSIAVAGGAIIGLGLIGHADSLAGSMNAAKQEAQDLKVGLFEALQPAARSFAPIQAEFFDFIPGQVSRLTGELSELQSYDNVLFELFSSGIGGVKEFFAIINRNETAITDMTQRFSGLLGSGVLTFFEWLLQTAADNQRLLISLGEVLISVAIIVYNLSMAIGRLAATFLPLIQLLAWASGILNSEFGTGLLITIAYTYILAKAVVALNAGLTLVQGGLMKSIAGMLGYQSVTWGAVAATVALATALTFVTLGISALAGGLAMGEIDHNVRGGAAGPGSARGGIGGQQTVVNNNTVNIKSEGNMSTDQEQRLVSKTEDAMKPPNPDTDSDGSPAYF